VIPVLRDQKDRRAIPVTLVLEAQKGQRVTKVTPERLVRQDQKAIRASQVRMAWTVPLVSTEKMVLMVPQVSMG